MDTLTKLHLKSEAEATNAQIFLQQHHIQSPVVGCRSALIIGKNASQALLEALYEVFKVEVQPITNWDKTFFNKCMDCAGSPSEKVEV